MGEYSSFQSDPNNRITQKDLVDLIQRNSEISQQNSYSQAQANNKSQNESRLEAQKGQQTEDQQKLKTMLETKQQQDNLKTAQDYMDQNAQKGRKVGVTLGGNGNVSLQQNEPNMIVQTSRMGAQQGQAFNKLAAGVYKPVNDQLSAIKGTIDNLDLGTAQGDVAALGNEAQVLSGGNARLARTMMDKMSGGKTAQMNLQEAMNYLNNTPNIPLMQGADRNAIRELAMSRLPVVSQKHAQISAQLQQQGPAVAPMADYNTIVNSYTKPVDSNLQQLNQMKDQYYKSKQGNAQNPVGNPAVSNANPTTLDKLRGMFHMGGQPQQAPQQAPQGGMSGPPKPVDY